jgi:DNA-binding IclR family transcriptional regulator
MQKAQSRKRADQHTQIQNASQELITEKLERSKKQRSALPSMKSFSFLEAVAQSGRPLGIREFSALLNVPQPTAHRIVHTLIRERLLEREPGTRRYGPGDRLARMGVDLLAMSVRRAPRRAILEDLSQGLGETCNLGMLSGNALVYLDRVEAAWPFGLRFEPGSRVPLYCTSMGKIFLSHLSPESRTLVLGTGPLHSYTANTIVEWPKLEKELDKIRTSGISADDQEFLAGVICVAVPIRNPAGKVVAAIAVSAPVARMSLERALGHVDRLQDAARRMEGTLWTTEKPPQLRHRGKRRVSGGDRSQGDEYDG